MATILVVDDEPAILRLCHDSVIQRGYAALTASSGTEALNILKEKGEDIDLVITDFMMPNMNGVEFMNTLHMIRPGMPVIVMTAHHSLDKALVSMTEGAFDYIRKPFRLPQLIELIDRALIESGTSRSKKTVEKNETTETSTSSSHRPPPQLTNHQDASKSTKNPIPSEMNFNQLFWEGYRLYKEQRYEDAREFWNRALVLKPNDPTVLHNLKLIEKKQKQKS